QGYHTLLIGEKIRVFSTNTRTRLGSVWRASTILTEAPMLISAQDPFFCGLAAWRAARRLHAKLEVQVHTDLFSRGYMSASVLNRLKSLIARFVLRRADTIRVVSQSIVHSLPQSLQHKAFVLPIYTELADDTEL